MLLIKSFIVGLAKIIPGVSGAMLAINFNIYERLLDSITNFFNNWKANLKFLIIFSTGIILAIILCSNIILYLLTNYKFITMSFFIGLIIGSTYDYATSIKNKNIYLIIITIILVSLISIYSFNNNYILKNNFLDNIIYFIGGIIEILASIIPGISATSLLMMLGIYEQVLKMITLCFNYHYVTNNINLYLSYSLGMFISFIITTKLIVYSLKKYPSITKSIILGLSISSIIILIINTLKIPISLLEFTTGIMLLIIGLLISCILGK